MLTKSSTWQLTVKTPLTLAHILLNTAVYFSDQLLVSFLTPHCDTVMSMCYLYDNKAKHV